MGLDDFLTRAIDRAFDRSGGALPKYVPATRSMLIGILVSMVVLLVGGNEIYKDQLEHRDSKQVVKRFRWTIMLLIHLFVCSQIYGIVQTSVYRVDNMKANSQHFANVFWLGEYHAALK